MPLEGTAAGVFQAVLRDEYDRQVAVLGNKPPGSGQVFSEVATVASRCAH
jgi:hypothetical protein